MSQQAAQTDLFLIAIAVWTCIKWVFEQIDSFISAPVKFWHVLILLYIIEKFKQRFEGRLDDVMLILRKWDRGWEQ